MTNTPECFMRRMNSKFQQSKILGFILLILLGMPAVSIAVPVLQLDINNGTYDASAGEESTITSENVFDLAALGKVSSGKFEVDDVHHISAALTPKTGFSNPADDFGSFSVTYVDENGIAHIDEVVQVTADMTFGIPPLEANWDAAHDGGDLGSHDIFDTYFFEFSFKFDLSSTIGAYNTEDSAAASGYLYQEIFTFDLTNLQSGYDLHFDLYNTKVKNSGDFDIDYFAPFSHDAGSARTPVVVSEPTSFILLLLSLGMVLSRRSALV